MSEKARKGCEILLHTCGAVKKGERVLVITDPVSYTHLIIVEQNSEMALSIADYAYVLEVGHLTMEGTGEELLASDEVQKKYLGA